MKRLHPLDFMAPPTRPWVGYIMLILAVASLIVVLGLLRDGRPRERAAVAGSTQPSDAGAPVTVSAVPPAAAAFAEVTGQSGRVPVVVAGQADAAAAAERLQVGQTRALAGPRALPWAKLLGTLQSHTGGRIELLRIEPHGNIESTPRAPARIRLTAQAREAADIDAFVRALQAEPRLRDVAIMQSAARSRRGAPGNDAPAKDRPTTPDTEGLVFALVAAWRDPPGPETSRATPAQPVNTSAARP
ncbi:MAG: hypothetical protein RL375_155 [Pseudomonadota bacterium]